MLQPEVNQRTHLAPNDPISPLGPAGLSALNYHKSQARFANLVVLAFLGVLVAFTLYRVMAEWSLAQQYQTVTEYKQNMEQAIRLEKTRDQLHAELQFILGKDTSGSALTRKHIKRTSSPSRRLTRIFSESKVGSIDSTSSQGELADLHRKYSPFLKECKLNGLTLAISKPEEFLSKALLEISNRILSEPFTRIEDIYCENDPIEELTTVPASDSSLLEDFRQAFSKVSLSSNKNTTIQDKCSANSDLVKKLIEIMDRPWYPDSPSVERDYIDNASCNFRPKFLKDSRELEKNIDNLKLPLPDRLARPAPLVRESEIEEVRNTVSATAIRKAIEGTKSTDSTAEESKIAQLRSNLNKLNKDIERLRQMKPLSDELGGDRDKFGLHQLLLSALFVLSALGAAVTTSYMARAHSFEVIEIERHSRGAHGSDKAPKNPFSKDPATALDIGSVRELLTALKANKSAQSPVKGSVESA